MKEIACLFISSSWAQAVEIIVNIFLLIWYVETRFHCITFAGLELNYVDQAGLELTEFSIAEIKDVYIMPGQLKYF